MLQVETHCKITTVLEGFYVPTFDTETNLVLLRQDNLNHFHGANTGNTQVLKSAAGYYIGDLYHDEEMGGWYPNSRDSAEYYQNRHEAETALLMGTFTPRI